VALASLAAGLLALGYWRLGAEEAVAISAEGPAPARHAARPRLSAGLPDVIAPPSFINRRWR